MSHTIPAYAHQHIALIDKTVASVALYFYDWMLTLEMEVDFIWPAPWNLLKIAYLVQRYLPMVEIVLIAIACKQTLR